MPHLQEYTSTLGMDGVDHPLPALNVFLSINSGRLNVSNAELGYGRCVGNEQPAVRRTLRVVLDHEITRDVARLGTHSRERREHDTVLQMEMSDFRVAEKLAHDVILKEYWVTTYWLQTPPGSRGY
jgi:hypothetical protein